MIHRAVLGSIERFMGIIIEHFSGALPFWLSPEQIRMITISSSHVKYCKEFLEVLKKLGFRVKLDDRNESMGLKMREAQKSKIPFSLVAGDMEVKNKSFSMRKYSEKTSKTLDQKEVIEYIKSIKNPLI